MEAVLKDGIYYITGDITESCDFSSLGLPSGRVKFDLGGVRSINSCGVREWISWILKLKINPTYINCPQTVVMQFNMVKEFLSNDARVESFQIPSYCEKCGDQKVFLLHNGKEFSPGQKIEYNLPLCEKDECAIEPEVDYESYFYFIEHLKK